MGKDKVVSIEDRIPKLKQARKKKANRRMVLYLSLFFILISIIVYLQTPLSHIQTITVEGNTFLSDEQMIKESKLTIGSNIWMVNKEDKVNNLMQNPIIEKAEVSLQLPWNIHITVKEHEHVAYVMEEEQYYPLFSNGTILSRDDLEPPNGDAPILVNFTEDEYLYRIAEELSNLSNNTFRLISEIHWQPSEEMKNKIILYMNDGYMVSGTIRDFSNKMKVYPSIVSQLEPDSKGMIHIGVGAYFESFEVDEKDDEMEENEAETE